MAAYQYYQQSGAPGWGTNQFQFGAPPAPNFQPQPSWGGEDFYRAHAINPDTSMYNHAMTRMRDYSGQGGMGVGMHEARHWHRRAYGGLGEINTMLPDEIGHAAAYEAYRTWIHNSSMYEPLSGDQERQREGLIGLAVAEASRLIQFSNRSMDSYARMAAGEAAAATASNLSFASRDYEGDEFRGRGRYGGSEYGGGGRSEYGGGRSEYGGGGSEYGGGGSQYGGSMSGSYDDPYAFDSRAMFSRPRSRSRHRSSSRHHHLLGGHSHSPGMGIPGVVQSGYGGGGMVGSYGGHAGSYGGSQYGGGMMPGMQGMQGSPYSGGLPMGVASSYGGQMGMPMGGQMAIGGQMPMGGMGGQMIPQYGHHGHRLRSNSFSMPYGQPQTQYINAAGGMTVPPGGGTIIIQKPHKKHRKHHKHRSHSHHRSRSVEPVYRY